MKKSGNILIVDDNRGVLTALQLLLKPYFDKITVLSSPASMLFSDNASRTTSTRAADLRQKPLRCSTKSAPATCTS